MHLSPFACKSHSRMSIYLSAYFVYNGVEPIQSFLQVFYGSRIRDPNMSLSLPSKSTSRNRRDSALFQKMHTEIKGIHSNLAYVRQDIESSLWLPASDAGYLLESAEHKFSSPIILCCHFPDAILWALSVAIPATWAIEFAQVLA